MKRVSFLTVSAAGLALGLLLVGGIGAGAAAGAPVTVALVVASAIALAIGLGWGWPPALAVATVAGFLAGVVLPGRPTPWVAVTVLAMVLAVGHEATRISTDLRRPARLGPGVLEHIGIRTTVVAAAAPLLAVVGRGLDQWRNGIDAAGVSRGGVTPWVVPVALALAAAPMALPALLILPGRRSSRRSGGRSGGRLGRRSRLRLVMAATVSVAVVGSALLGSVARHDPVPAPIPVASGTPVRADDPAPTTDTAVDLEIDSGTPRRVGGNVTTFLLIGLVAGVIVLLVSGLRRNRIPLTLEPVELGPEEPGLDVVMAGGALLDDEAVALTDEVAAALVAEISVDLRSEPDPGRAVRYAYARVEQRLAAQGIERRPAESEPELLTRALRVLGDDGRPLADLTALFERARFSTTPVPESMRAAAIDALDRLRSRLEVSS